MSHLKNLFGMRIEDFVPAFSLIAVFFSTAIFSSPNTAASASLHLTASSPWQAYADPLGQESGVPLIPAIFDALTLIEVDGTVTPALAESWYNDSGTVWTFKLRPNIVFSDGSPLNAEAVVDSLSLQIGTSGLAYSTTLFTSGISGVRALSDFEVEITTNQKDARLDRKLSNVSIFNAEVFRRIGRTEFSRFPIGTGPFKPERWSNNGRGVVLKSVPTSWRASRQVDRVEFIVVPDASARLQSLLSDGTDISSNIDPDMISTVEGAGYKISVRPAPIILAVILRTNEDAAAPLHDRRVRAALSMAIDRDSISQNLLLGTMEPATQFATSEVVGFDPTLEPYTYDPDQAKKLLAEAGYPNGFELIGRVMTGQFPGDTLIYQQVAQDLTSIGVKVELGTLPTIEFIRRRNANSWQGVDMLSTFSSHYRLGDITQSAEFYTCFDPRSTFCDPEMDELLSTSHQEMDPVAREQLLKSYSARFHHLTPAIMVTRYSAIDALSKRLVEIPESPAGKMRFELMEIIEE